MHNKKLRNDLILIISLVVIFTAFLFVVVFNSSSKNLSANIYLDNEIVKKVDLTKTTNDSFVVKGKYTDVTVEIKDGSIRIKESGCPHQDCVRQGFVNSTNKPIICAYNHIAIYLVNNEKSPNDIEI